MKKFKRYIRLYENSGAFEKDTKYGIHHFDPLTNEYVIYLYKIDGNGQHSVNEELRMNKLLENQEYETGDINT